MKNLGSIDTVITDFNGDLFPDIFRSRGGWDIEPFQNDLLEFNTGEEFSSLNKTGFLKPTNQIMKKVL